jgi:hypothetical protein
MRCPQNEFRGGERALAATGKLERAFDAEGPEGAVGGALAELGVLGRIRAVDAGVVGGVAPALRLPLVGDTSSVMLLSTAVGALWSRV